jgi:ribosome-associated protein
MAQPAYSNKHTFLDVIVDGMQNLKANNITVLDLTDLHSRCTDFFVICQADSSVQVSSIAQSVQKEMKEQLDEAPVQKEGVNNAEWVLLDYGSVIVHVFQTETRSHYDIEGLWADANIHEIEDIY